MVVSWSPEPSKSKDDWLPRDSNHIITLDDESDDDTIFPLFGYELLPHDINNEFTEEAEVESDTESNESQEITVANEVESDASHKVDSEESPRQDIVINLDEVREAMTNVTLPESAIPPWAASVPESQWTSFLLTRIRNMQNPNQTV